MAGPHIALVGCGKWGSNILRDLVGLGCQVTVVARSASGRSTAEQGGAGAVVGAIDALPAVDGAVVATPTDVHAEHARALLDRGVSVFCEKPLCDDPTAARRLADDFPDQLFVMDKWRYHPGVEMLGVLARAGRVGAVTSIHSDRLGWSLSHDEVDGIWVLAPHDLSIFLEITGAVPTPVAAAADVVAGEPRSLTGLLRLDPVPGGPPHLQLAPGGASVTMAVSTISPVHRRQTVVNGTEGTIVLGDSYAEELLVYPSPILRDTTVPEPERVAVSTEWPLLRELRAFLDHLGGGPPPRSSAAEASAVVACIAQLRALAGLVD